MHPNDTPKLCECGCGQPTQKTKQADNRKGLAKDQPYRFLPGHNTRIRQIQPIAERFWNKVNILSHEDCWEWQSCKDKGGRGRFGIRSERVAFAHRMAWELTYGPIPDGMFVCHRCDNPPCCNPAHLFLGTTQDNTADMVAKGRNAKGEKYPRAKLTADNVRQIRQLCADGAQRKDVAKQFGISTRAISDIVQRKRWKHID